MSAAKALYDLGLSLTVTAAGGLKVEGFKALPQEVAERALALAREYKAAILAELAAPRLAVTKQARRRITSAMLENFRAGCAWLLPNMERLKGTGWTSKRLFGVGSLAFPIGWGIAWTSSWTDPTRTPALQADGSILWEIREAVRTVYQANRPALNAG